MPQVVAATDARSPPENPNGSSTCCPSCGSAITHRIGPIPATGIFAGQVLDAPLPGGSLYRCGSCHLCFRSPRLDKVQLDRLYEDATLGHIRSDIVNRPEWEIAGRWIGTPGGARKVLDVGCFDGSFLAYLSEGFERYGIEIHEPARQRAKARGVRLIGQDFSVLSGTLERFDVVVALDVIEHVPDPRSFLRSLVGVTGPGGAVIVSTGNVDAPSRRFMGSRYWYFCTSAGHISFISPTWCRVAAPDLGLEVAATETFRIEGNNPRQALWELGKNVFYKLAPGTSAWMRGKGWGEREVKHHRALWETPPIWLSARDQFITFFRKR